jgi:hypothetical protein
MRSSLIRVPFLVLLFTIFITLLSCSPAANKKVANTALDLAQIACILLNAESDDATLQKVCGFAQDVLPDVQKLVSEQRAASRRYAAERAAASGCVLQDAGAPVAPVSKDAGGPTTPTAPAVPAAPATKDAGR